MSIVQRQACNLSNNLLQTRLDLTPSRFSKPLKPQISLQYPTNYPHTDFSEITLTNLWGSAQLSLALLLPFFLHPSCIILVGEAVITEVGSEYLPYPTQQTKMLVRHVFADNVWIKIPWQLNTTMENVFSDSILDALCHRPVVYSIFVSIVSHCMTTRLFVGSIQKVVTVGTHSWMWVLFSLYVFYPCSKVHIVQYLLLVSNPIIPPPLFFF